MTALRNTGRSDRADFGNQTGRNGQEQPFVSGKNGPVLAIRRYKNFIDGT